MAEHFTPTRGISSDELTLHGQRPESRPREAAPGAYEAFVIAYERIRALARVIRAPAAIVAAVTPQRRLLDAVLVEDASSLIIGRHGRCGLRLTGREVALRQSALLVLAEGDTTTTRVWDLNTGTPFFTEEGQPSAALSADGPCYFTVHGHGIWVIPADLAATWPARTDDAWAALPRRVLIDRRPAEASVRDRQPAAHPTSRPPPEAREAEKEISHVTLSGAPLVLGEPEDVEVGWGTLRIEHGARRRQHHVSAERLERGVLVGRYERCGLAIDPTERDISRVHALLVKIGADLWAIDTASSNGLWRGRFAVVADVLADFDAIMLGKAARLCWERYQHPEA